MVTIDHKEKGTMTTHPQASPGKSLALMALIVIVGFPMVAYLWETLNDVLALKFEPTRLLITAPVLLVFIGFLILVARHLQRWNGANTADRPT